MEVQKIIGAKESHIAAVKNILLRYNQEHLSGVSKEDFAVHLKEQDQVIAGITGSVFGNWLEIDFLAVEAEFRGQGYGRKLLQLAEELAVEQQCQHVLLYTFDFQGPNFYPKFGYQEIFVLDDYPINGKQHWFLKEL